jgi:DNA mismatch repair protein MutS2
VHLEVVNEKTRLELGWEKLCRELAARARTPMGRERCLVLAPGDEESAARQRLARVEEARTLRRLDKEVPLADALDLRPALGRAAREGTLEPQELVQIARLIQAVESARRFLYGQADRAQLHFQLAETLSELEPLAQQLFRAFDSAGKLLDTASPLLGELRQRARGLHRAIKGRLTAMLLDETVVGMLREAYYSVRGDRYVLPVRAEHKSHLPGIVHNASGSGQTLFIEPQELLELGNQLTIAESSALEEEQRILAELSQAVGAKGPQLEQDVATLAVLDEAGAGARLADDLSAHPPELTDPLLGGEGGSFRLSGLRHPLLVLQMKARAESDPKRAASVVENDVALPPPARGLIVSGPNAGGKTVTITAVGLCALMARAGLPIPAGEGSRVPLYRTVYTAIGDEGDLSRDLSTFTAHLTALKHILEAAGPGTLVLIDEIAADTDPREGAAIAVAALERLVDGGAQVLITTHLEELKALGLSDPRFASASVGFDVDRLAPTYKLAMGEVGASSAIEIARRVGLPQDVCERARTILGGGSSALSLAVEKLERERADAARARIELQEAKAALEEERERFERERLALRALEKATREGARAALIEDIELQRAQVAQLVAQLQAGPQGPKMAQVLDAQRELERAAAGAAHSQAVEQARAGDAAEGGGPAAAAGEAAIVQGSAVRHARLGNEGVVLEVQGDEATVQLGSLRSRVKLAELVPLSRKSRGPQPAFRKSRGQKMARAEAASAQPVTARTPVVDVRGKRVDEAIRSLEVELDHFLRSGEETVHVVHGHGSGALKAAVREHLARSPYVARVRPAEQHEGGDGVSVLTLRG